MNRNFKLLETTLRDGSYTINYQFNATETGYIAKILDEIGFEYIEIGPGIGFNAKEFSEHTPASTDEEYILAARSVVKNAKIGMFFIPGIGRMQDIDVALKNGLDLIRIGTNINEYQKGFQYIEQCKKYNIETASNLMKSYAISPTEFGEIANECYSAGADYVYLVDSAGGMLPQDVKNFINAAKEKQPEIRIGFHGHDNLGLAIANTLAALECGATIVDSSIRGMGRSSGNTITEKLIFVLKRMGYELDYNMSKLLDLSDNVILDYLSGKPEKTLDMIYGFSQFHSSFIGVINKYSEIHNVDPKDLIVEYTKIDKLHINEETANRIAESLSKTKKTVYNFKIENKVVKKMDPDAQLQILYQELNEQKHKFNKRIFFNISRSYESEGMKISPVIHSSENISFANAEASAETDVTIILNKFKNLVDGFLLDDRLGRLRMDFDAKAYYYNDADLFAKSMHNHLKAISEFTGKSLNNIFIDERIEILDAFRYRYSRDYVISESIDKADAAILGRNKYSFDTLLKAENLKWVIVSKPGSIETDLSKKMPELKFIRLDLSREIFTEIFEEVNYSILMREEYGVREINHELYCSGGYVGSNGSIVVDNINNIRQKFGIANGDGSINYITEK